MNFDNLKNYVDKIVDEYKSPCADLIVYKDHKMIFRHFAGMKDREAQISIKGDELYYIFSMTKMITCVSALQLMEKGKFILSDPVSKYLPAFKDMKISEYEFDSEEALKIASGEMATGNTVTNLGYAQNPITIKDLFTMGAGLDYNLEAEGIKNAISSGRISTRDIVDAIGQTVLGFEPGTRFRYSLCHDVLGALIEIWSGQRFGDYVKENIFEPLGMKDTFFGDPKTSEQLSRMCAKYKYNDERIAMREPLECRYNLTPEYESGGAGLISRTEDYALFTDALACGGVGITGKRILSPATIDLMSTNHLSENQLKDFFKMRNGYGYGLGVRTHYDKNVSGTLSPLKEFGWDGAAGGFSMVDTKNKLSVTLFQHVHLWDKRIHTEIRNILYSSLEEEIEL